MARKKDINEKNIINFYMEYVLTNGKKPDSVFSFSKQYNFTEEDYYKYIKLSKQKYNELGLFETTLEIINNNKSYNKTRYKNIYF